MFYIFTAYIIFILQEFKAYTNAVVIANIRLLVRVAGR